MSWLNNLSLLLQPAARPYSRIGKLMKPSNQIYQPFIKYIMVHVIIICTLQVEFVDY